MTRPALAIGEDGRARCGWVNLANPVYMAYHDTEWGVPVYDDTRLFEMLTLEGAQAGLSWETVLKRREAYREAFHGFAIDRVVAMTDAQLEALLSNQGLIRHRQKIFSTRSNAQSVQAIQRTHGSFSEYLWGHVGHTPIRSCPKDFGDLPTRNALSDALAKDLKKRGMSFVGSTILYAYMQAIGMLQEHMAGCFCALQHFPAKQG